jgi:DNA modification methylase
MLLNSPTPEEHLVPNTDLVVAEWRGNALSKDWRLFFGPALETLRLLEKASVDCVVTSPPYFWLRDYGIEDQLGHEETVEEHVNALSDVMDEIYRVLRPGGTLFLNISDTFYSGRGQPRAADKKCSKRWIGLRATDRSGGMGIGLHCKSLIGTPWRVAIEMCRRKWILRSSIIWIKKNGCPEPKRDRPRRSYEFIFMFAKGRHYHFDRGGLPPDGPEDVWEIAPETRSAAAEPRTAPFPDELVERCLAVGCPPGGTVLDPFCGSGTTLRVALREGHDAIGIDLNREFCEFAVGSLVSLGQTEVVPPLVPFEQS